MLLCHCKMAPPRIDARDDQCRFATRGAAGLRALRCSRGALAALLLSARFGLAGTFAPATSAWNERAAGVCMRASGYRVETVARRGRAGGHGRGWVASVDRSALSSTLRQMPGTAKGGLGFGGPASVTEAQILAGDHLPAVGWGGIEDTEQMQLGGHSDEGHSDDSGRPPITWAGVREATEWDGFCGRRKRRSRDRSLDSPANDGETDWPAPFSPATHRAGLAWGAGMERRSLGDCPPVSRTPPAQAPATMLDNPACIGEGQQQRTEEGGRSADPYAWRAAEQHGQVRLLSDEQLLQFEGGMTSFPLGGHRQRFDLSSLKHRWCQPSQRSSEPRDVRTSRGVAAEKPHHLMKQRNNQPPGQQSKAGSTPTAIVGDPTALSGRRVFCRAAAHKADQGAEGGGGGSGEEGARDEWEEGGDDRGGGKGAGDGDLTLNKGGLGSRDERVRPLASLRWRFDER